MGFDLQKRGGVRAAAHWIREGAKAEAVLIVLRRPEVENLGDASEEPVFEIVGSMTPEASPRDVAGVVAELLPGLADTIQQARRERRARRAVEAYGAR